MLTALHKRVSTPYNNESLVKTVRSLVWEGMMCRNLEHWVLEFHYLSIKMNCYSFGAPTSIDYSVSRPLLLIKIMYTPGSHLIHFACIEVASPRLFTRRQVEGEQLQCRQYGSNLIVYKPYQLNAVYMLNFYVYVGDLKCLFSQEERSWICFVSASWTSQGRIFNHKVRRHVIKSDVIRDPWGGPRHCVRNKHCI